MSISTPKRPRGASPSTDFPAGLEACPIIAEHFFGLDAAAFAAARVASPAFQHRVKKVARLGERAIAELLAEIGAKHDVADEIDAALLRFGSINPQALTAAGGDRFPPSVTREVA